MADADLDVIIRQHVKQQHKSLTAAVKARRDRYLGLAGKAKDAAGKQRFRQLAKIALEEGTAAAKRLQMSADNAADSYACAMRRAAETLAAQQAATPKKAAGKTSAGKTAAKSKKSKKR